MRKTPSVSSLNSLHRAGTHRISRHYPWDYDAGFCCGNLVADGNGKLVANNPVFHCIQKLKAYHKPKSTSYAFVALPQKAWDFWCSIWTKFMAKLDLPFSRKKLMYCKGVHLDYSARKCMVAHPVMPGPCQQMAVTPHCVLQQMLTPGTCNCQRGAEVSMP